jgi:hypothetical protein
MIYRDVRFGSSAATARSKWRVRFTPESCRGRRLPPRQLRAKSRQSALQHNGLFDHLVGEREQLVGNFQLESGGGLEIASCEN